MQSIAQPSLPFVDVAVRATRARTDDELAALWVRRSRSAETRRAYAREYARLRAYTDAPLHALALEDLIAYREHLVETLGTVASRARAMAAVRSLLSFAVSVGYLRVNVGAAVDVESPTIDSRNAS